MNKLLIWISLFTLTALSCGIQTARPTSEPVSNAVIVYKPTPQPTTTETSQTTVKTLGTVNVRICPSTSCEAIDQTQDGQVLEVGAMITNGVIDCNRWYPVQWTKKDGTKIGAFVCAGWMNK
jgi:hypothetical protein